MKVEKDSDKYDEFSEDLDCINRNLTRHIEDLNNFADRLFGVVLPTSTVPDSKVEEVREGGGIMGQITEHIQGTQTLVEEAKMAFFRLQK